MSKETVELFRGGVPRSVAKAMNVYLQKINRDIKRLLTDREIHMPDAYATFYMVDNLQQTDRKTEMHASTFAQFHDPEFLQSLSFQLLG